MHLIYKYYMHISYTIYGYKVKKYIKHWKKIMFNVTKLADYFCLDTFNFFLN